MMNSIIRKLGSQCLTLGIRRNFSRTAANNTTFSCKLVVVGGGSGGCTIAAKFARRFKKGSVIVVEPSTVHYYQPLWTLVGAGIVNIAQTKKLAANVLPENAIWIQDSAACINIKDNFLKTEMGHVIHFEYAVIAVGLKNDFEKVPGLCEALSNSRSGVSTIYSADFCEKTHSDFQNFQGGDAIFTYPDTPIKCPGAPQKIAYLADSFFTKSKVRSRTNIMYNTCLPVIFGVKKYADALLKVAERKQIKVNYNTVLKKVLPDKKEAIFYTDGDTTKEVLMPYDLLHVSPPMKTPAFLHNNKELTDSNGYLEVDKYTLQHTKFPNIYGIGDCTNTPNSKTAAAIAKQSYVLEMNLLSTMQKDSPKEKYNGYGACPLVTSFHTCILAEFIYDGVVRETLPFNQARESIIAFYMKKELFPFLYWRFMLKGHYHGPEFVRKIINPFAK